MPASRACKFKVASSSSSLTFDGKSTLHAVHGTASQLTGSITAAVEDGALALEPPPEMHVEFPVERLSSGNGLQDKETWKLLDSKRNPNVAADLRDLTSTGNGAYRATGDITMSGRKKTYRGDLTIKATSDRIALDGALVIDIRDFGLQPPRLLMVSVEPQVTVKLHLVAVLDPGGA